MFIKRYIRGALLPIFLLALVLLSSALNGTTAYAEEKATLSLQTETGYGGKIKIGSWNPVKLTLTSDEDIAGDIVIQLKGGMNPSSYVQHVELPKDTPKEVIMSVPGDSFNKDNNEIRFYKNSVQKGKWISFTSGTAYLKGTAAISSNIGVLSEDPDAMNFLNVLRSSGYDLNIVPLKAKDIPEDPMLLDGLDVVVVNRFASDTLSQAQTIAMKDWVRSGGQLVLAGGAGYPKTSAAFTDISPVQYNGTFSTDSLPELAKLGGKQLNLGGELTLSDASPAKVAEVLYRANNKPLFASLQVQQGSVLYAAYDLTMEPLASWGGHPSVWSYLLRDHLQVVNKNYSSGTQQLGQLNNVGYILDYFPTLKMPAFKVMVWLLLIYAIIVAPLLYWILKKTDKREWAWWIIPLIAVIASGTVYTIGSSDKTKELAHTLNFLELDGNGNASAASATAFFTPRSGKYNLEFPQDSYLTFQQGNGSFGASDQLTNLIEVGAKETKITLRDMPQWSTAKMMVQQRKNRQEGKFDVQVSLNDKGEIEGQVTNQTPYGFSHAALVLGGNLYNLGDLGKGEAKQLSAAGKPQSIKMGSLSNALFGYATNRNQDNYTRERDILNNYVPNTSWFRNGSYVIAWSKDALMNYTLDGKEISSSQLNLWSQPVKADWSANGVLNVPYGFIVPNVTQVNAPGWYEDMNGWARMDSGSVTFEYSLPSMDESRINEMSLQSGNPGQNTEYQIYNYEKKEWEALMWDSSNIWKADKEAIDKYMAGGRVRLMLTAKAQIQVALPEISLKGVTKP